MVFDSFKKGGRLDFLQYPPNLYSIEDVCWILLVIVLGICTFPLWIIPVLCVIIFCCPCIVLMALAYLARDECRDWRERKRKEHIANEDSC